MKLNPDQIAKIEEVLSDIEDGCGNRAVIVKHGINDILYLSHFLRVLSDIGIRVKRGATYRLSRGEMDEFVQFLRAKREERERSDKTKVLA